MSWEILALAAVAIVVILLVIFRKNPHVKKYWKYSLVFVPLVLLIILKIIIDIKNRGKINGSPAEVDRADDLREKITELKDQITEVQLESAIEISAAKSKNEEVIKELEEVKQISDKRERRRRLADMIG